jgi:hypothetical protein
MNTKILTGVRQKLFLIIAQYTEISQSELCGFSWASGGELIRINHHLMGLESEGFIELTERGKRGDYKYKIARGKGERMLKSLQKTCLTPPLSVYDKKAIISIK